MIRKYLFIENNIHFPKDVNGGEDYVVCVKCFITAKVICNLDKILYNYNRCNENSIMNTTTIKKIQDQIDATRIIEKYLENNNLKNKYKLEIDTRKFRSKLPLLKKNPMLWKYTFPESNYIIKHLKISLKSKILIYILNTL